MDTEADFYVAVGDLVNFARGLDKAGEIMRKRAGKMFVIPGNHESEANIADFCAAYGFFAPHGQLVEIGGRRFGFLGYSNTTPFDTPGEYTEEELASRLQPLSGCEILVCHCPPHNTPLDEAGPGKHFGSQAIAKHIERTQPEWFFCGHIHEAAGAETIFGRTKARNLGKQGFVLRL